MVMNPPEGYQRIVPYLMYADAPAAIDYLCETFGFTERFRMEMDGGGIGHGEVQLADNVVMMATAMNEMGMASPQDLPFIHSMVMVYVDDVDAHHAHAVEAGAKITRELETKFYGDRTYMAVDPEGHNWASGPTSRTSLPRTWSPPTATARARPARRRRRRAGSRRSASGRSRRSGRGGCRAQRRPSLLCGRRSAGRPPPQDRD